MYGIILINASSLWEMDPATKTNIHPYRFLRLLSMSLITFCLDHEETQMNETHLTVVYCISYLTCNIYSNFFRVIIQFKVIIWRIIFSCLDEIVVGDFLQYCVEYIAHAIIMFCSQRIWPFHKILRFPSWNYPSSCGLNCQRPAPYPHPHPHPNT